jgi:hypothetical protein
MEYQIKCLSDKSQIGQDTQHRVIDQYAIFAKWLASKQNHHVLLLLMCLDNKKLLSLEIVMATNPWMYSRTPKKQHGKK